MIVPTSAKPEAKRVRAATRSPLRRAAKRNKVAAKTATWTGRATIFCEALELGRP